MPGSEPGTGLTDVDAHQAPAGLSRQLGLGGLAATGICSMLGASVYVVPFMIQRNVPGIGDWVLPAFLFAALPALLAAFAYALLASAMPRAGGSYLYASRGLHPYLGFVASFSQWFGLSIVIGVIAYIIVSFLRDIATGLHWDAAAALLDTGPLRVAVALALLWLFVGVNLLGARFYERTLIPLMLLMFGLGAIVVVVGFGNNHADFVAAVIAAQGEAAPSLAVETAALNTPFHLERFLAAAAILFSSFIGFDSIAQAGGEARAPSRNMPLAIAIAILSVGAFYFLFTAAVYHAVPWTYVADEALQHDISAPGLFTYLLPGEWAVALVAGAAIALINDLPAMLLSVSRLIFAWSRDGIFPRWLSVVHPQRRIPQRAIIASGAMASIGVLGSHFAGDFFLGIDIMVMSMLVNFLLMCVTLLYLPRRNPTLAKRMFWRGQPRARATLAAVGVTLLCVFLVVHVYKDLSASKTAWYFHSTLVWLVVMLVASAIFLREFRRLQQRGVDTQQLFSELPAE